MPITVGELWLTMDMKVWFSLEIIGFQHQQAVSLPKVYILKIYTLFSVCSSNNNPKAFPYRLFKVLSYGKSQANFINQILQLKILFIGQKTIKDYRGAVFKTICQVCQFVNL